MEFVAVRAKKASNTPVHGSKLLGEPYWPASMPYPRDRDGHEMMLLAQINFGEVPPLPDYPDHGILQFFISASESSAHIWGMSMEALELDPFDAERYLEGLSDPVYFRVVYHADRVTDEAQLRDRFLEPPKYYAPISSEASLAFAVESEVVIPVDYRFERHFGQSYWDFFDALGETAGERLSEYFTAQMSRAHAKIDGYASFAQEDPRGLDADTDWVNLLWIDSFYEPDGAEAMWGDAGTALFAIRRSDLRMRDFSRVLYSWDNH